jgi:2-oxoglutarate ferredoxin oxidoreductase subunit alpha
VEGGLEALPLNPLVNDFSLQVATVNGSGSQTANTVLLRAICGMGIPVSGKNLFPSNIAGLPTWYTIRVSERGWVARKKEIDFLVCMNAETAVEDAAGLRPGGAVVWNDSIPMPSIAADRTVYSVPFEKLVDSVCPDPKLKKLVVNMVYVGVVGELLGIEATAIEAALVQQLGAKKKALEMNRAAIEAGRAFASASLPKRDPFRVERRNKTSGKILIEGNSAAALGSMFGGVTVVTWYPITPSSSLVEALIGYLEKHRRDPNTGKSTYCVVQAEDEIAAIGMVLGAGWAGARAMTSTSGPGLSLMTEFTGLGYYAEIPAVIWDIQRIGPSTGLPTRTSQGDVLKLVSLSHGDTKHVVLLPSSVRECFEFGMTAFDLAERLQTPIFVASDLDLGMNTWMSDPFPYPDKPLDRGKVLTADDLKRLGKFERYRDVDADGIPYRTLPGTNHPLASYFTRGSGHDEAARYTESGAVYVRNMDRLRRKYETAKSLVPGPRVDLRKGAEIGILGYGSSHYAIEEARDQLRAEGLDASYLLLRAIPFGDEVRDFFEKHERVHVVDQNRDGQMADLLRTELTGAAADKIRSIRHYDGLPLDARTVTDAVLAVERVGALAR